VRVALVLDRATLATVKRRADEIKEESNLNVMKTVTGISYYVCTIVIYRLPRYGCPKQSVMPVKVESGASRSDFRVNPNG
jgi:hypothetical protein